VKVQMELLRERRYQVLFLALILFFRGRVERLSGISRQAIVECE
jgi:hypothetical protein